MTEERREKRGYAPPQSTEELLLRWLKRLRASQFTHYVAAGRLARCNLYLGIPVVALTAAVGTSVFASLAENGSLGTELRFIIGVISIAAAVLASLQTFLGFSERAEKHRATAARYGIARRDVELLIAKGVDNVTDEQLNHLRASIDNLALDAPGISDNVTRAAEKRM
jgi:hypothetical protein